MSVFECDSKKEKVPYMLHISILQLKTNTPIQTDRCLFSKIYN